MVLRKTLGMRVSPASTCHLASSRRESDRKTKMDPYVEDSCMEGICSVSSLLFIFR